MTANGVDRFRARFVGAAVLAALVVAGGMLLERGLGPRELTAGEVPSEVSGAWFCPHGGGERWRAWVVAANPTDRAAQLRVITYGGDRPIQEMLSVEPRTQRYVEVAAEEAAASTAIEYFGGPVAGGMVVERVDRDGERRGLAAEPCLAESGTRWYLPEGSTRREFGQRVVVLNPFPQEAVISLWLTDEQETLRPGELSGVVLPGRRARSFDVGEFALGKETLSVTVDVGLGTVVTGAVGLSDAGGLRSAVGVREPSTGWVLPGAGEEDSTALTVHAPGGRPAPYRVRRQGADEQTQVAGEESVEAGRAETIETEAVDAGLIVESEGDESLLAGRRLAGPEDLASLSGVPAGAERWVATPATGPEGGRAMLFVQNPGDEVAEVRISFLTETGAAEAPGLSRMPLRPGSETIIDLSELLGEEAVSALVVAETGAVVAGQAAIVPGGYAVALGVRLDLPDD